MRKVTDLNSVQLILNDLNNQLDALRSQNQDLHGRQIKNAGDATDPQDFVTLKQMQALDLGQISGQVRAHQVKEVSATAISGNINSRVGIFNTLSTQQLTINGETNINGADVTINGGNLALTNGAALQVSNSISTFAFLALYPTYDFGNNVIYMNYPGIPPGNPVTVLPNPNPFGILNIAGFQLPAGYGIITGDSINMNGGLQNNQLSEIAGGGLLLNGPTPQTLLFGSPVPAAGIRLSGGVLQSSNDLISWNNLGGGSSVLTRNYVEYTGTSTTFTAGAGFSNVPSLSITVTATGTWFISINVFVQQTGNFSTLRLTQNGTPNARQVVMQGGAGGNGVMFHMDILISATSGDVFVPQLSATTSNAAVLGSGNSAMTNMSAIYMGS